MSATIYGVQLISTDLAPVLNMGPHGKVFGKS